ncbi:hypothetical protein [Holophaga foetida]|uniref:hypothetical protein n=1 Tax=Holophaga foetida TaxID=35839 RepID=UPI0002471797|nr:hypothetical protein [Holophaga foetida]
MPTRLTTILMLALLLFLPGTASAQRPEHDAGEFVIISAQYGTERHHVDVTQRLREGAKRDRMFRASNATFGVDPAEGKVKTLRIYARGPHGREEVFEYREGSMVDGSKFRGWGRGDWGSGKDRWSGRWGGDEGEFLILSAQYGTRHHHVDVTQRLREGAKRDRMFRASNETFGVDPDQGKVKTLRIYARGPHGREEMFEYREGSMVDGSKFRGWGRGEWGDGKDRWSGRWDGEHGKH